jgi:hypothetical protein
MSNRKLRSVFYLFLISFICQVPAIGQITVTGPTCVIPGTIYEYLINGKWDSTSTMQVCLTGGVISGKTVSCTGSGKPVSFVLVQWSTGSGGSVNVSSTSGNSNLDVAFATPLTGGLMVDTTKIKSIAYNSTPTIIRCSASTGGSCNSHYSYQWQESDNIVSWSDIKGANAQDLVLSYACKQATYFRRKVVETNSGSMTYSDYATVNVAAPPPGTHSFIRSGMGEADDVVENSPKTTNKIY